MTSGHREPLDAQQYPSDSVEDLSTTAMLGGDIEPGSLKGGRRLVGQALLYSISAFISLGVFLVCPQTGFLAQYSAHHCLIVWL